MKFKKITSIILSLAITLPLSCLVPPDFAALEQSQGISTPEEFINMSQEGSYHLENDIDFSGKVYDKVIYSKEFHGTLDGKGHSLLGINIKGTNADAGVFAIRFSGALKNITLGSESLPISVSSTGSGYSVAAVAGTVNPGASFENVRVYANVKGDGKTAGFTSYMPSGTLTVKNCKVYGSVTGNPASGFICMSNDGSGDITVLDSENFATVSAGTLGAGGFYAVASNVSGSRTGSLTVKGCVNHGAVSASDWRVGGIVGEFNEAKSSRLEISYCYNTAPITMTGGGGYAGGIIGGICFDAPDGERLVSNVYNIGSVRNTANTANAFAIAFAHSQSSNVKVKNALYTQSEGTKNCISENVTKVSSAKELEALALSFGNDGEGRAFVKDSSQINEGYPLLSVQLTEHTNTVSYDCGRKICLDCGMILSDPELENHAYEAQVFAPEGFANGYIKKICRHCRNSTVESGEASVYAPPVNNGAYVISTPEQLMWYSECTSLNLTDPKADVVLSSDIDMKDFEFSPINHKNGFEGCFDGQLHKIKNLKITADNAALFEKLGKGAKITDLAIENARISALELAGTVFAYTVKGALVSISNVSVTNSVITSESSAAGALSASTKDCAESSFTSVICDGCEISGKIASGISGIADNSVMKNVYVNAQLHGSENSGTLGTHTSSFKAENCGYASCEGAKVKDGKKYSPSAFQSGEISYLVNTYGAVRLFGVLEGRACISRDHVRLIRIAGKQIYTVNVLSASLDTEIITVDGKTVILHKKDAKERIADSGIEFNNQKLTISQLTLCRYVTDGESYAVAPEGYVIYTLK